MAREKKKTGRKPILRKLKRDGEWVWNTPISDFLKAVKLGMSNQKASEFAGFDDASLYDWLNRAESDLEKGQDSIYVEFYDTYKKARAECQAFHLQNIVKASQNGNWQASAWMLERIFPSSFAQSKIDNVDDDKIEVVNDVPRKK